MARRNGPARVGAAWSAASGRQRATIITAALVALLALGSLGAPASPPSGGGQGAADAARPQPTVTAASFGAASAAASADASASGVPVAAASTTASPGATPRSTAAPTPKLTPVPTPKPTPRPASLTLTFASLTSPISRGSHATAVASTTAGAGCSIVVEYASGPSQATGLGPRIASPASSVSWTWKVGPRTTPGSWPVTITCSAGGATKSVTKHLTVQ
jgi:hypothetical protein